MKHILIAGATGYLGGFVVREFKARGWFVRALARSPEKLSSMQDYIDEIVKAQVTRPGTLEHVCDDMDMVFSSIGITVQKDGLTFKDVDYQGNLNLLQAAQQAGVKKFVYVSGFKAPQQMHLAIVKAHEDFVAELKRCGMDYSIIRSTGFMSELDRFWDMAKRGRVYFFGPGNARINPIHGADLAKICADAGNEGRRELDAGGPEVFTWRQLAELIFKMQGKPVKITGAPVWLMRLIAAGLRLFNKHDADLLAFHITMMTVDMAAPMGGTHTLEEYLRSR